MVTNFSLLLTRWAIEVVKPTASLQRFLRDKNAIMGLCSFFIIIFDNQTWGERVGSQSASTRFAFFLSSQPIFFSLKL